MHPSPADSAGERASRYVTTVDLPEAGVLLIYGGLGGRLVEVPASYRAEALALLDDRVVAPSPEASPLRALLRDQGILVPKGCDEVSLLRRRYECRHRAQSGWLGLTLCPTIGCNFCCTYCYQHHSGLTMSRAVQERVVRFVEEHVPAVTSLSVTWFGGEPLLALPVIERLSSQLADRARGRYDYHASIVTNGYLLAPDTARLLADLHVTNIQITLDGPRDVHDKRRPLASGAPTFDRIVGHIAAADPRLCIAVRVNVDRDNVQSASLLFDQLDAAGLRGRISVYFAPVTPYTDVCEDVTGTCIGGRVWSKTLAWLHLTALDRGYGGSGLPSSRTGVCLADSGNGFVVRPDGLVCNCWNDVAEPDRAILDLMTGTQTETMKQVADRWASWNPFELAECVDCKFLPQCLGGCPYLGLKQGGVPSRGDCEELKHNLPETVATYYLGYRQREMARQLVRGLHQWLPSLVPDADKPEQGGMGRESSHSLSTGSPASFRKVNHPY